MSHGLLQLEKAQSRGLFLTLLNIGEGDEAMDAFDRQRNKETAKSARRALKKKKKIAFQPGAREKMGDANALALEEGRQQGRW